MKVEIDFKKNEITILEPIKLKELQEKFTGIDFSEFTIVSKVEVVHTTGYNQVIGLPNNINPYEPNRIQTIQQIKALK